MAKPLIWIDYLLHPDAMKMLEEGAEVMGPYPSLDPPEVWEALSRAQGAVISGRPKCSGEWMDRAPKLQVLARFGIGYDNIVIAEATQRGICVVNTPEGPTEPTAEQALTFLLMLARRIKESDLGLSQGRWLSRQEVEGTEVLGKTVGVIGLGRIGGRVAEVCGRGLRMRVVAYDPYLTDDRFPARGAERVQHLDDLLAQSDFVTLHVPLTSETKGMANRDFFAKMKPGSFFINVARGPVMVEADLVQALQSGHIAAAGVDVFEQEPTPPDNPLLRMPNVVVTPHVASNSNEGNWRMGSGAVMQTLQVLQGERPPWLVNPDVWERRKQ
ncbi:MAG: hydroxyacid dehydrogenase [Chloroflexi bacterium]|nr:hydroxyacid dehydrogenase [Chloroflexota bacterium]